MIARRVALAMGSILVLLLSVTSIRSSLGLVRLPIELVLLDEKLPHVFRVHMAASGLALGLGLATLLCRHAPRLHRPLGRVTAAMVVIGGLTALPSALLSESTLAARTGFVVQACVWLTLVGIGLAAIRAHDIARHRRAMLSMYAVASGALWLRLGTASIAMLGLPFETFYAVTAWLCWSIPLGIVWWMTRRPAALVANASTL